MHELIEKWRPLLDVGDPVIDEKNAARCLEDVQQHINTLSNDLLEQSNILIVPLVRKLLSEYRLNFDPDLESPHEIKTSWSLGLMEDLKFMHGIDISSEMSSVVYEDFRQDVELNKYLERKKRIAALLSDEPCVHNINVRLSMAVDAISFGPRYSFRWIMK